METILIFIIGIVIGFLVAGILIFRNKSFKSNRRDFVVEQMAEKVL